MGELIVIEKNLDKAIETYQCQRIIDALNEGANPTADSVDKIIDLFTNEAIPFLPKEYLNVLKLVINAGGRVTAKSVYKAKETGNENLIDVISEQLHNQQRAEAAEVVKNKKTLSTLANEKPPTTYFGWLPEDVIKKIAKFTANTEILKPEEVEEIVNDNYQAPKLN